MRKAVEWFLGIVLIAAAFAVGIVAIVLCLPVCFLWHVAASILSWFQEARP